MTSLASGRLNCRHGELLTHPCTQCDKVPGNDRAWWPSDELDASPLGTAEQERRRAKSWVDDAARYARNAEYWQERALTAESSVAVMTARKRHPLPDWGIMLLCTLAASAIAIGLVLMAAGK